MTGIVVSLVCLVAGAAMVALCASEAPAVACTFVGGVAMVVLAEVAKGGSSRVRRALALLAAAVVDRVTAVCAIVAAGQVLATTLADGSPGARAFCVAWCALVWMFLRVVARG